MRHRAAVGLSEETDALVVVVSEETGRVSVAYNGRLIRYPDVEENSQAALLRWIRKAMPRQKTVYERLGDWFAQRREKTARLFSRSHKAVPKARESAATSQEGTSK
jgi:DNA integrity scanning protein DisA with diadenylate cyclase activity